MKYIDANKQKRFEEMLADIIVSSQGLCTYEACKDVAKKEAPALIDSLQQEEPDVDFEIGKYMTTNLLKKRNQSTGIFHLTQKDYTTIARHFYELGKNSK